jgi:ParB family chromosome partitioning protein
MTRVILPIAKIDPDREQPRRVFDAAGIKELSLSMKNDGLLSPILVRPQDDRFVIIAGERRFRAAHQLGWKEIAGEIRAVSAEEAWLASARREFAAGIAVPS